MKKNGFTFIEILGVITLLALISTIAIIVVDKNLKNSKETIDAVQLENVKSAANMWMADNIEKIPDTGYYTVSLKELINTGYISSDILNDDKYDNTILISVAMNDIKVGLGTNEYLNEKYHCNDTNTSCIINRAGLEKLAEEVNNGNNMSGKTYVLVNDIDFGCRFDSDDNPLTGCIPWTPIGISETTPFSGTFDGAGHVISGMYIESDNSFTGMFVFVKNGVIKNLGVENSVVKSNQDNVGTITGRADYTQILNCYSKANVYGEKTTGGLIGLLNSGILKNSYNAGKINGNNKQFTAGIVGYSSNEQTIIENCYNYGEIESGHDNAGIVGGNQGKILNCYNLGNVKGNFGGGITGQLHLTPTLNNNYNVGISKGGIARYITDNSTVTITNNHYLSTSASYGIHGSSSNEGASPLEAKDMPSVLSVINGDDAFVEDINNINNGYPILSWELNRN